jgi:hypothetical protein
MSNEPKYMHLRTWDDFEQLRKANPNFYFSSKVQMRLHKMAAEQGDAFYSKPTPTPSNATTKTSLTDTPVTSDWDRQERIARLREQLEELEQMNQESTEGARSDEGARTNA